MSDEKKKYRVGGVLKVYFHVEVEAEDEESAEELVSEIDEGSLCDAADFTDVDIDDVDEV